MEPAQAAAQFALRDVEQLDLQHRAGLDGADQELQAAPGGFDLLKFGMVQDQVDLRGQQPVDLGDDGLERAARIGADEAGEARCALRQGAQ